MACTLVRGRPGNQFVEWKDICKNTHKQQAAVNRCHGDRFRRHFNVAGQSRRNTSINKVYIIVQAHKTYYIPLPPPPPHFRQAIPDAVNRSIDFTMPPGVVSDHNEAQNVWGNTVSSNKKMVDFEGVTTNVHAKQPMTTDHGTRMNNADNWLKTEDWKRTGASLLEDQIARERVCVFSFPSV